MTNNLCAGVFAYLNTGMEMPLSPALIDGPLHWKLAEQKSVLATIRLSRQSAVLQTAHALARAMRPYYEDPCRYRHHHHHHRPNIEIDVFPGWGGAYYPPPVARPEVVVVTQASNYMPVPGGQVMMPQPYTGMSMGTAGYYQQQQGYQYQYQQYNNPPYPQW